MTTIERALEILRTARPCGTPNTVEGVHVHNSLCNEITGYTQAEGRDLTTAGLAAELMQTDVPPGGGSLHITPKGRRAVDNADTVITFRGRPVLTTAQAAQRHGRTSEDMRALLSARRYDLAPVAELDGRTPLYDLEALDAVIDRMVGRGKGGGRKRT